MNGPVTPSRLLRKQMAEYPWLGAVRHVEAFQPLGFLSGVIVGLVVTLVAVTVGRMFPAISSRVMLDGLTYALLGGAWMLFVLFVLYNARRRLVICEHGLFFGAIGPMIAIRFEFIDMESLTPLVRFNRIAREVWGFGERVIPNGSSQPFGHWGIAFRIHYPREVYGPDAESVLKSMALVQVFYFGTRDDPRRLLELIAVAAADHGIRGMGHLPGLTEEPVALTGRSKDAARQLPRIMASSKPFSDS
ncbi:MAG: hypothetical protein FWF36_09380 [Propionibacteriaceae bacterium]|nr:hypothetical protein [Propionibacteriaceae bacterium]